MKDNWQPNKYTVKMLRVFVTLLATMVSSKTLARFCFRVDTPEDAAEFNACVGSDGSFNGAEYISRLRILSRVPVRDGDVRGHAQDSGLSAADTSVLRRDTLTNFGAALVYYFIKFAPDNGNGVVPGAGFGAVGAVMRSPSTSQPYDNGVVPNEKGPTVAASSVRPRRRH
jgi:hypothetical protein